VGDEDDGCRAFGGDRAGFPRGGSGREAVVGLRPDPGGARNRLSRLPCAKQRARADACGRLLLGGEALSQGACLPEPAAGERAQRVGLAGRGLGMADEVDQHGARIVARRHGYEGRMATRNQEDLDRELIELLNELRVALPGVQVLFAFLLAVPFSQRFNTVTDFQKDTYFFTLLTTTAASIMLIAPTSYHRLRWRRHDKERLLRVSNKLALAGTLFLAAAMTSAVLLITDVLFGLDYAIVAAILTGLGFAIFWYGLAGWAAFRERGS
jgi:hypothetical protein